MTRTASQVGKASRDKGKAYERSAVALLKSLGFPDAQRTCQHAGRAGLIGDVACPETLPNIVIECKAVKALTLGSKALDDACIQAIEEAGPGKAGVVMWWEARRGWRFSWRQCVGCPTLTMTDAAEWAARLRAWNNTGAKA